MRWIMKKMNVISRCQAIYRSKNTSCEELKPVHHTFILTVAKEAGLSQDQIAERVCMDKSGVARVLNYLEERGYVRREVSKQDKRVLQVFPTERLEEALPRVRKIAKSWNEVLTADFTEEEMDLFVDVLSRMEERAKALAEQSKEEVETT